VGLRAKYEAKRSAGWTAGGTGKRSNARVISSQTDVRDQYCLRHLDRRSWFMGRREDVLPGEFVKVEKRPHARHASEANMTKPPLIADPPWTMEEDARLRRLAEEGRSNAVVAERLKRTQAAVYKRTKQLGVTLSRINK